MDIEQNINRIHQKIDAALRKANRANENVTLVGATKTVDPETIQEAISSGLHDIGENRVQEMMAKYDRVNGARWHVIGTLQRNKVKYIIDKAAMIQSLESLPLAREIDHRAGKIGRVMPVLVQVNPANEKSKSGLPVEEVAPFIESIFNLENIKVMGLMMIAPYAVDRESVRPYFSIMKQLFDEVRQCNYPHTDIQYLSMGMSNDFETAIEEGSNMVRIGTALFGKRRTKEWQENS